MIRKVLRKHNFVNSKPGEYTSGGVIGFKYEIYTTVNNRRYYSTITLDGVQMPTVNRRFS